MQPIKRCVIEIDNEGCLPAIVGSVQTFGDLVYSHLHIHAIVAEGLFNPKGHFVAIPAIRLESAMEIWRHKVFDLLFEKSLLDLNTIESMMAWKHSGFNMGISVRIEANDTEGLQRLIEYHHIVTVYTYFYIFNLL